MKKLIRIFFVVILSFGSVKSEIKPCWVLDKSITQLCMQNNSSKSHRPPISQDKKIIVTPIVEMKDVMAIDSSKKTIKIDLRIILVWNDNRLALSNTSNALQ